MASPGTRVLLKFAGRMEPSGRFQANLPLSVAPMEVRFNRLFDVPPEPSANFAAAAVGSAWYSVEAEGQGFGPGSAHPWDLAHLALNSAIGMVGDHVIAAEPDIGQDWPWTEEKKVPPTEALAA